MAPTAKEKFVNALTGVQMAFFDAINSVFNASGANHTIGFVPDPGATPGTTRFLREDATWATTGAIADSVATNRILGRITTPPDPGPAEQLTGTQVNTILPAFTGDSGSGGVKGLVPAPAAGDALLKVLNADGTFKGAKVLLNSGVISSAQATLDIVLTSWTTFRDFEFHIQLIPATDGVDSWVRFSTDGGSTYDAGATNYGFCFLAIADDLSLVAGIGNTGFPEIQTGGAGAGRQIGNGTTEGWSGVLTLLNPVSTALWSRIIFNASYVSNAATPIGYSAVGQGQRKAAQDTNAVRFMFSSGNIATGAWAVYGIP